jgi:hypothetical protein
VPHRVTSWRLDLDYRRAGVDEHLAAVRRRDSSTDFEYPKPVER